MALTVSEALSVEPPARRKRIWSVGGGKGGIGKSLIAASLGYQLSRMGQRVVLVDADLGGANLHTCLGLPVPERTLADFIQRRLDTLEQALTETGTPGLRLLSGAADLLTAANIKHMQKVRVLRQVKALDVDVVLIDIGAGTSFNILDFFLLSDVSILTVVPEPSSIENGYRFIKSGLYRRLRAVSKHEGIRRFVEAALDPRNELGLRTPVDLVRRVEREDAVWQAVRRRRLFMADAPTSRAAEEIRRLTRGLWKGESLGPGY